MLEAGSLGAILLRRSSCRFISKSEPVFFEKVLCYYWVFL